MSTPDELIADRYRLVRLVGSGAMGAVWEARDERLGRIVALKLLHRQFGLLPAEAELANQRAMREARITARLHHRHAVPVFDVVEHEGRPCLVMQFLPSVPLSARLKETGPLPLADAARVGAQVASALAAAHAEGIVHRDVKPGNILLIEGDNAVISDFGISHAFGDATLTATGLVHGTPAYMAPEVALGGATTAASDVFSLGSTLYATVEGTPPFGSDSNTIALLHRVASGQFAPPQAGAALTPILTAMLAVDPQARPTMKEVEEGILAAARAVPTLPPVAPIAATVAMPPATSTVPLAPVTPVDLAEPAAPKPPVVAPPSWGPPPAPRAVSRPPQRRDDPPRRTGLVIALVVLVLIAAVVTAAVLLNGVGGTPSAGNSGSKAPAASTSRKPSSSPTASATPTESETSSASASASSPSSAPASSSSPSVSSPAGSPSAAELAAAITGYYALMPKDTDGGWSRLSSSYQVSPSGGRSGYNKFWAGITKVSVASVVGKPPNQAEATVTYTYKKGNTVRERTSYGLIDDGGVLKINSSRVIG